MSGARRLLFGLGLVPVRAAGWRFGEPVGGVIHQRPQRVPDGKRVQRDWLRSRRLVKQPAKNFTASGL